ncbi:MAG TPA: MEKHLA domain-containing protein, partial [Rhizomicrobium sp.]|nr:MEKHLA domain-containing protein [Rhizomicrobium sp.]
MDIPGAANDFQSAYVARLAASFDRATGGDLVREAGLDPAALGRSAWEGPFALLSHGPDAILNYA